MATKDSTCAIHECERASKKRGWCNMHYQRWRLTGDPLGSTARTPEERFWAKVNKTDKCWIWTAHRDSKGYGRFSPAGRPDYAHRISYEMAYGGIPEGMQVDHECHNRACVNPSHIRLTTSKQNNENHSGPHANSTSGVRGVYKCKRTGRWQAVVVHDGRAHYAGKFDSTEEAEAAVIAKRNELHTHNDLDRVKV